MVADRCDWPDCEAPGLIRNGAKGRLYCKPHYEQAFKADLSRLQTPRECLENRRARDGG